MNAEPGSISPAEYLGKTRGTGGSPRRYMRFGMFHLDLRREELLREGRRVKLQGKVYQALLALLEKPGEVVTREALRMRLWPADTHVNYDANVNTTVNKLRQVLGDSPGQPVYVDTVPRMGYSFVAKIEYLEQPAAGQALLPGPQPGAPMLAAAENEPRGGQKFFPRPPLHSKWFAAVVISLVVAGMLFGAALILYAHRAT